MTLLTHTSNPVSADMATAITSAKSVYASPVVEATGVSVDSALSALKETREDVAAAIQLIGWKTDFATKEKADRPTKTETKKAIRACYDIYDLLAA